MPKILKYCLQTKFTTTAMH